MKASEPVLVRLSVGPIHSRWDEWDADDVDVEKKLEVRCFAHGEVSNGPFQSSRGQF